MESSNVNNTHYFTARFCFNTMKHVTITNNGERNFTVSKIMKGDMTIRVESDFYHRPIIYD